MANPQPKELLRAKGENSTRKFDIEDFFFGWGVLGGGRRRKMPVIVHSGQIPQPLKVILTA